MLVGVEAAERARPLGGEVAAGDLVRRRAGERAVVAAHGVGQVGGDGVPVVLVHGHREAGEDVGDRFGHGSTSSSRRRTCPTASLT